MRADDGEVGNQQDAAAQEAAAQARAPLRQTTIPSPTLGPGRPALGSDDQEDAPEADDEAQSLTPGQALGEPDPRAERGEERRAEDDVPDRDRARPRPRPPLPGEERPDEPQHREHHEAADERAAWSGSRRGW
jgi:hypothetical protein